MKYYPRNDFVLIRISDKGETESGIAVSQYSVEGKIFTIVAVGTDVDDLVEGGRVLMLGAKNATYFEVPGEKDLIVMKQEHVVLTMTEEVE